MLATMMVPDGAAAAEGRAADVAPDFALPEHCRGDDDEKSDAHAHREID
jgi:hypothetical protein